MVIVDRRYMQLYLPLKDFLFGFLSNFSSFSSMTGSGSSTTNYPGKIPPTLHLPSDAVEKSHDEKDDANANSVD